MRPLTLFLDNTGDPVGKAFEARVVGSLVIDELDFDGLHGGDRKNGLANTRPQAAQEPLVGTQVAIAVHVALLELLKRAKSAQRRVATYCWGSGYLILHAKELVGMQARGPSVSLSNATKMKQNKNRYCFPLRSYQNKGLFFFCIMYFLLWNPNLKSVFCGRAYKYVFKMFFFFFWFVCLVRLF